MNTIAVMNKYSHITAEEVKEDLRYLKLLSQNFRNIAEASTEIINLEAILNLPKGTEHFLADLHGEYEAFCHVLKNGSGSVKRKVNELFGTTLREAEKKELCTLIYYPQEKLERVKLVETDLGDWYFITLNQLVNVCRQVSSKYTRSKVQKALPFEFSYILQELLHESSAEPNKHNYINVIISTIISTGRADDFIIALCLLIQRFTIDSLHIIGDIYDRGPGAHIIMDTLCDYHNLDIQWGNHDILWMGAASGNDSSIANVLRLSLRYGNMDTLEDGYGINMLPLATFAMEAYQDDPCSMFVPKLRNAGTKFDEKTMKMLAQMHKAITIIQFKLEAQLTDRHPEFKMEDRKLLHLIDFDRGVFVYEGKEYPMLDTHFPTIDPAHPYALTPEEQTIVDKYRQSFLSSERLKKHMHCLFSAGSMYKVCNANLLFHASIPLSEDGSFRTVTIHGKKYQGKKLLDKIDQLARTSYYGEKEAGETNFSIDYMWYLWCGQNSPLFDKSKMGTFERTFLNAEELSKEVKGFYYLLRNEKRVCEMILKEFGIDEEHAHIINGHVPVRIIKGEQPMRSEGKLLVIDGGFCKEYQPQTGIAGYTLVYHSHGLELVQHQPFESAQRAIDEGLDIKSTSFLIELSSQRMMVKDTDKGKELISQIMNLNKLLYAYRNGLIKESANPMHIRT